MIKVRTIGMIDVAKINPVLKSEKDVKNYDFITVDEDLYLVSNTIVGDDSYKDDVVLHAGELLNGHLVKAWEGQELIVDGKHIEGGVEALAEGSVLVANEEGKLAVGSAAGVHFVVTKKATLTEAAVIVKVVVA